MTNTPPTLTGGCLCGSIRYQITSTASSWPPVSSTCQCTMCRKWTSSLVASFLILSPSQITPPLATNSTYREFTSSPRRHRGFCSACGSSLIWRSDDYTDTLDLFLGTIDEEWLVGDEATGRVIATPSGTQFWRKNAVGGVTDLVRGGLEYPEEGPDGLGSTV